MPSQVTAPPPKEHIYYGLTLPELVPAARELWFFRNAPEMIAKGHPRYTGEGRLFHAQQAIHLIWGKRYDIHDWGDACLELFCEYGEATVTGPKSAGKTATAAVYALLFWLSSPADTGVLVCSPSGNTLRRALWKEIKKFYHLAKHLAPQSNLADYKMAIQAEKNDDAHGIFGLQVAQGQTERAMSRLIGFHPKNVLVIVDEATDTPEAIDEAFANLDQVAGEFQVIRLGNAKSRFDTHGRSSEPAKGWASVTVEDEFWLTKHGACLHLDGLKSPNILLGKRKWPYLIDQRKVDADAKRYGDNSPQFWRFVRGFWPPDGLESTVLTETMAHRFNVKSGVEWMRQPQRIAMLDPAYGGDRCILRIAEYGECRDRRKRLLFTEVVPVQINASAQEPVDYQIARQVREACKERAISPNLFGMDSTGSGRGVAAILQREWSGRIQLVEFSAAATSRPVSVNNPKECREEYDRFVTEAWFQFRLFVECDQIRGMDDETLLEFYSRRYETRAGGIFVLETKEKMKERTGGISPDLADAAVVGVEVCRRNGFSAEEEGTAMYGPDAKADDEEFQRLARANDVDSLAECYSDAGL